jgi:hypothetical protein
MSVGKTINNGIGFVTGSGPTTSGPEQPTYDPNTPLLPPPGEHFQMLSPDCGDFGAQIAKLALEAAYDDKHMAQGMRRAEENAQQRADDAQLKAMEREADAKFVGGVVGGACSVGAGVGMARGGKWEGIGRATDGGGRLVSAVSDASASAYGIEAKRQEQLAGRHQRAAEDARDAAKDASDMIDRTIEFYKEYRTAQVDNQKAAIHRA